jgi:hypothetical protein
MLKDELGQHIEGKLAELQAARQRLKELRSEIASLSEELSAALRVYEQVAGHQHEGAASIGLNGVPVTKNGSRLSMVLRALDQHPGPMTLDELVQAMPDSPERGAVSAAVHRAIKRGEVRSIRRGVYELIRRQDV